MRIFETNIRIRPDKRYKDFIKSMVSKNAYKRPKDIHLKPFRRNVDFWFFAFCLAIKKGLDPIEVQDSKAYNLTADASVLSEEVQTYMAIIAIQTTGDIDIIKNPNQMLKICNNFAAAGFDLLEKAVNDGDGRDNLELLNELSKEIIN